MKLISKAKNKWNSMDKDKLRRKVENTAIVGISGAVTYLAFRVGYKNGVDEGISLYDKFITKTVLEHPGLREPLVDAMSETLSNM